MFSLEQRTFASGHVIPTAEESYDSGYRTGIFWPDEWESHGKPGGPSVYSGGYQPDERSKTWAQASKEAYEAWHRGYRNGHEAKRFLKQNGITLEPWSSISLARAAMDRKVAC